MFIYRNKLRLGYDCEVYVGQNLMNGLMSHGFKVYHDFPATDTFNIDHIAVGPTGVFAIETKGRAKQVTIEKDNWQVTFDGTKLIFPSWTEDRPVIQATAQAKWLSEWLSSATGQPVTVSPVLAIPGWFVKMKGYTGLKIYNGKNPEFLAKPAKGQLFLDGQAIQSISHQLEAKCRDIKSTAYRKD